MKRPALMLVFVLSISLLFSSCGGGGGGGTSGGVSKSTVTIGGQVVGTVGISNLVAATKAGLTKSATDSTTIGGAKVSIESYHNGVLDKTYETTTDKDLGTFSSQIELFSDGGYIIVNVEKDGLVKYSKTFNYKKPEDLKGLNLKAELAPYLTKVVSFNNISSLDPFKSSAEGDTLSIAIIQDSRGIKKLAANNEIKVAKASGGVVKWQMDLSKSMLKAASSDIGDSIIVKAQNYNPTNDEDMKSFPADSDTSGNKLVSTGFDFIDIKTATGKAFCITKDGKYGTLDNNGKCSLSSISASKQSVVQKSAITTFKVKRQIDDCKIAKKDEDSTKSGKQVGFYIYRGGKWLKIGNATLYKSGAFGNLNYGQFDDSQQFSDTDTCSDNDRPYAVFTEAELKQASQDLGFDLSYHNFDYVAMGELKTYCVEGEFKKVKKNEKSALSGLYLYLNSLKDENNNNVSGFRASYGYTDENGKFRIEGVTTDIVENYNIELSFSDPFTGKWIQKGKKLKPKAASGCYQIEVEEVSDPFECTVTGKATKSDGTPYKSKYLWAVKDQWYGYKYTYTDENGLYTLPVVCGGDYVLTDGYNSFNFKVDGTKNYDEIDDTGKQVVLNPPFPNNKPYVYAYANQYNVKTGDTVQLYGYAMDPDGDAISYSWQATGGTFSDAKIYNPTWTVNSPGTYTLTLTVSDGKLSNTAIVTIEVFSGNRPPKITYLYAPFSVLEGDTANLYASVYDPDGDAISYSWQATGGTFNNPQIYNPTWTVNSPGTYTLTLTVSDGNTQVSESKTITVYADTLPVIVSLNIPSIVTPSSTNTFSAYAYDPEGKAVTYSWQVSGGNFGNTSTFSSPTYTAPTTEGNITVTLTVSDGNKTATKTATVSVKKTNTAPTITNFSVSPNPAAINTTITLTATATDNENDTLTFSFYVDGNLIAEKVGGASLAKAATVSTQWTPRIKKSYTIDLVVSDGALNVKSSKTFTVSNSSPQIVSVNVPSTATVGTSVTFTATATDADGDTLTYTWYVNGVAIGQGNSKSYTFTKKGDYKVKVSVNDGTSSITSSEYTVTVPNSSPQIVSVNVPLTATVGTSVTFTATATDADGDTLTYTWYDGATQIGQGQTINWTPQNGGVHVITVKVSDGQLQTTSAPKSIDVNTKPQITAIVANPSTPQSGQTVTLTATATDADGDTLTYEWYIQSVKQNGTGSSITWTPSSSGTYTVEVRVSDGKITTPVTLSKTITVTGAATNQPPQINAMSVTLGTNYYTLSVSASDPDNQTLTYTWYINDVTYGTGATLIWVPQAEGTYTVKVVVSDGIATVEQTKSVDVKTTVGIIIQ